MSLHNGLTSRVKCPTCGAEPKRSCFTRTDGMQKSKPHVARVRSGEQQVELDDQAFEDSWFTQVIHHAFIDQPNGNTIHYRIVPSLSKNEDGVSVYHGDEFQGNATSLDHAKDCIKKGLC